MMLASGQTAVFNFRNNRVLLFNSPFVNPSPLKKSCNFNGRFRVLCVIADKEIGASSSGSGFLDKDFRFTPSFQDYVKVMEAVKLDRSKNLSGGDADAGGFGSVKKKNSAGKPAKENGDDKGKRDLVGFRRKLPRAKDFENEEKHNAAKMSSKVGGFARRGQDRESKLVAGSGKIKNGSRWASKEGVMEKGTEGRNGALEDGKKISLHKKFMDADRHFENGNVACKENWKNVFQKEQEVARDVECGTSKGKKDAVDKRRYERVCDVKMGGIYSGSPGKMLSHDHSVVLQKEHVESDRIWTREDIDGLSGEVGDYEISHGKNKHLGKRMMERKMNQYDNKNLERETFTRSRYLKKTHEPVSRNDAINLKTTSFPCNNTRKTGDYFDINKNMSEKDSSFGIGRGMAETNFERSETEAIKTYEDHDGKDMHSNDVDGIQTKHYGYTRKQILALKKRTGKPDRNFRLVRLQGDAKKAGIRNDVMQEVEFMQSHKVVGGFTNDYDFEDRAAFKTFEVFTDVKNRPRVLRMEMEERIQQLAKQLHATDINIPQWKFSKMMHSAKIKFTDHSILRVVQILGTFGNWKRALQVVEWLHFRERFKSYKSRYIHTAVLDVLGKAKRPNEALNIFYAMRQELSSYPDLAAYHCIAVTLGQAGFMKELFDVIDCMRTVPEKKFKLGPLQKWDPRLEPDLVVYNAVLNACVQQKQWEGAFWVLQQLKKQGIKPSNTTYGLVMEVMLASGKYNLVYEFFRKVEKTSIPGALNYKVLINALWREGKIDEAVQAVMDMERRGIVGSASLYYDIARCLCSVGRCQEALQKIKKISKVAKKPLVITYTGLIQTCLESGSIENGELIFNEMLMFCSPNIVTCNIMLKSFLEHGMFVKAKDLFHKILDGSYHMVSRTGLDQKVLPDKFTFNIMIEACAKLQKWDDFENAYEQMLCHGYHFDTRRHLRMVLDAFRAGKRQILESTWKHLICFSRVPPPPLIRERFCIKLMEDDTREAISCIGLPEEIDIRAFSERSWLELLDGNADRFKNDTITRLVHELTILLAENEQPHPVYENLVNAIKQFVSDEAAVANLRNDMKLLSCNS